MWDNRERGAKKEALRGILSHCFILSPFALTKSSIWAGVK